MTFDLDAYLARIRYDGPREPNLTVLRRLHQLHPDAIPFETLDARFGMTPQLDLGALQAKLVRQKRGGWCFEHNLLFQAALQALGFAVEPLMGRVRWRRPLGAPPSPRGHRLCRVTVDGEAWIADVGFGGLTLTAPLRLSPETEQATPHEPFRLVADAGGLEQQALLGGEWTPTYWFSLDPSPAIDDEVGNWFFATHPQSHFKTTLMAARVTPQERLTLMNNDFARRSPGGASERRRLGSGAEIAEVLRHDFGIEPPPQARLDDLLSQESDA